MVKSSFVPAIAGPNAGPVARAVCEIALLALIGLVLARLFWLLVAPQHSLAAPVSAPGVQARAEQARAPARVPRLALLTSQNAFSAQRTAPAEDAALLVPETSLNLKLQGLRALATPGGEMTASATIVTPDNRQRVYSVGDKLIDGVFISRILSDRVILDKNGQFEALFLEGRDGNLRVLGGTEPRQEVGGREVIEPAVFRVGPAGALLSLLRLVPVEGEGLRVVALGSPDALAATGLSDGDVVSSVDGQAVTQADYEQLIARLTAAERVTLAVRRENQTRQITLVFEE